MRAKQKKIIDAREEKRNKKRAVGILKKSSGLSDLEQSAIQRIQRAITVKFLNEPQIEIRTVRGRMRKIARLLDSEQKLKGYAQCIKSDRIGFGPTYGESSYNNRLIGEAFTIVPGSILVEFKESEEPKKTNNHVCVINNREKLEAETRKVSISMLQRRLRVGYKQAARIIETMEKEGLIGPSDGIKARKVYVPRR